MKDKRPYALLAFAALALASPCQAQHRRTSRQHNSTPQQALDKREDAFQADKAKGVHASYQWKLSGPNGGDWWLIVNDGTYKMGRGKIHNPNVTFVASDKDWVAMSNKTLNVSWAYLTGRLKIQGSHRLVIRQDFSLKLGMNLQQRRLLILRLQVWRRRKNRAGKTPPQSIFHQRAQRNVFRRRDLRQQSRSFASHFICKLRAQTAIPGH
jgi:putative sterol carrier protein